MDGWAGESEHASGTTREAPTTRPVPRGAPPLTSRAICHEDVERVGAREDPNYLPTAGINTLLHIALGIAELGVVPCKGEVRTKHG
jgi:hypothetical protein